MDDGRAAGSGVEDAGEASLTLGVELELFLPLLGVGESTWLSRLGDSFSTMSFEVSDFRERPFGVEVGMLVAVWCCIKGGRK